MPLKQLSYSLRSKLDAGDIRAIRTSAWFNAPLPLQFAAGIAQAAMTARALGVEGFGILAIYFAVTSVIYGVLSSPASEVITTYVTKASLSGGPQEPARITRFVFVVAVLVGLLAFSVIVVFAIFGRQFVGLDESHTALLIIFGLTGLLSTFQWEAVSILRLADKMRVNFIAVTIGTGIRLIVLVATLASGWHIGGVVTAYVVSAAVSALIFTWAAIHYADAAGIPGLLQSTKMRAPREVLTFQLLSFGKSTVKSVNKNVDTLLLSNMLGIGQLGLFRAAKQISEFTKQPFTLISAGVQPEYSRKWYVNEISDFRRFALKATVATTIFSVAGFGLLLIFRRPIIELVLGPDFTEASELLVILIPAAIVLTSTSHLTSIPAAIGNAAPSFWAGIVALIVQLIIIVAAVPTFGLTAAAWAIASYSYIVVAVTLPSVYKVLKSGPRTER